MPPEHGIVNSGSMCYAIAGLQLLRHVPALHRLFVGATLAADVDVEEEWKQQQQLRGWVAGSPQSIAAVAIAVCKRLETHRAACPDTALKSVLQEVPTEKPPGARRFPGGVQHDAYEFLMALQDAMFAGTDRQRMLDELHGISMRCAVSLRRDAVLAAAVAAKASDEAMVQLRHEFQDDEPHVMSPQKIDRRLELTVYAGNLRPTLLESIEAELHSDGNEYFVQPGLSVKGTAQYSIVGAPPPVLLIHLSRLKTERLNGPTKRGGERVLVTSKELQAVHVPMQLDLASIRAEGNTASMVYELCAVAAHTGRTASEGHWTTYGVTGRRVVMLYNDEKRARPIADFDEEQKRWAAEFRHASIVVYRLLRATETPPGAATTTSSVSSGGSGDDSNDGRGGNCSGDGDRRSTGSRVANGAGGRASAPAGSTGAATQESPADDVAQLRGERDALAQRVERLDEQVRDAGKRHVAEVMLHYAQLSQARLSQSICALEAAEKCSREQVSAARELEFMGKFTAAAVTLIAVETAREQQRREATTSATTEAGHHEKQCDEGETQCEERIAAVRAECETRRERELVHARAEYEEQIAAARAETEKAIAQHKRDEERLREGAKREKELTTQHAAALEAQRQKQLAEFGKQRETQRREHENELSRKLAERSAAATASLAALREQDALRMSEERTQLEETWQRRLDEVSKKAATARAELEQSHAARIRLLETALEEARKVEESRAEELQQERRTAAAERAALQTQLTGESARAAAAARRRVEADAGHSKEMIKLREAHDEALRQLRDTLSREAERGGASFKAQIEELSKQATAAARNRAAELQSVQQAAQANCEHAVAAAQATALVEVTRVRTELQETKRQLADVTQQRESRGAEIQRLQREVENIRAEHASDILRRDADHERALADAKTAGERSLRDELSKRDAAATTAQKSEMAGLKLRHESELQAAERAKQQLVTDLQRARGEQSTLRTQVNELTALLDNARRETDTAKREQGGLKTKLRDAQERTRGMDDKVQQLERDRGTDRAALEAVERRHGEQLLEQKQESRKVLEAAQASARNERERLEAERDAAQRDAQRECEERQKQAAELVKQHGTTLDAAKKTETRLHMEIERLKQQVAQLERGRVTATEGLTELSAERDALQRQIDDMNGRLDGYEVERRKALALADKKIADEAAARARAEAAQQTLRDELATLRRQQSDLYAMKGQVAGERAAANDLRSQAEHRLALAQAKLDVAEAARHGANCAIEAAEEAQDAAEWAAQTAARHAERTAHDMQLLIDNAFEDARREQRRGAAFARLICEKMRVIESSAQELSDRLAIRLAEFEQMKLKYDGPEQMAADAAALVLQLVGAAKSNFNDGNAPKAAQLLAEASEALDVEGRARATAGGESPAVSKDALAAFAARADEICDARDEVCRAVERQQRSDNSAEANLAAAAVAFEAEKIDIESDDFGGGMLVHAASTLPERNDGLDNGYNDDDDAEQQQLRDYDDGGHVTKPKRGCAIKRGLLRQLKKVKTRSNFVESDGNASRLLAFRDFGVVHTA